MKDEFHAGRAVRLASALGVVVPLVTAGGELALSSGAWSLVRAVLWCAAGVAAFVLYRRATRGALIAFGPAAIRVRGAYENTAREIPRADVVGIAWANTDAICFSMRSGGWETVGLRSLSRADRAAAAARVGTWLESAAA